MGPSKRQRTSTSWEYFTPNDDNSTASCRICLKDLKTTGGCTTGLGRHLLTHNINVYLGDKEKDNAAPKSDEVSYDPIEQICRLAACDGLPFAVIANSPTLRTLFKRSSQFSLPLSPNTIREKVLHHYEEIKSKVINEIAKRKGEGKKFSLTLDEWTSAANRRYMNVNLHDVNRFWNLGLVRIFGSFTSDACLTLLQTTLAEFGVKLEEDVFGIVTDGASVMKRFGQLSKRNHQLCYAHGIHLAVIDVLYKKPQRNRSESDEMVEIENENAQEVDSDEEEEDLDSPFQDAPSDEIEYEEDISLIISKVRTIVKMFRRSPLKTEALKRNSDGMSNTTLILDTRTRWNSLLDMLERFACMKESIRKAFIDLREDLMLTDEDFRTIENIVHVLAPVKVAAEVLCRRDVNLMDADITIKFMLDKVSSANSDLGNKLFAALFKRITERRTHLSEIITYLHFGKPEESSENFDFDSTEYFPKMESAELVSRIKDLCNMYKLAVAQVAPAETDDTEASQSLLFEIDVELNPARKRIRMEAALNEKLKRASAYKPVLHVGPTSTRRTRNPDSALLSCIRQEMLSLDTAGTRGTLLQNLYDMLLTIPPCSVESERVFSSANNFCRKTRSKLADKSLNALVFLKSYFLNH